MVAVEQSKKLQAARDQLAKNPGHQHALLVQQAKRERDIAVNKARANLRIVK